MKNKSLLIIGPNFEKELSGPAIGVKNVINGLKEKNINIHIIKGKEIKEIIKIINILKVNYVWLNGIKNSKLPYFLIKFFSSRKFIIGPNFFYYKKLMSQYFSNILYLSPGNWHKQYLLESFEFKNKIEIFKFPISKDIENLESDKTGNILIYYKNLTSANETEETIKIKKELFKNVKNYLDNRGEKYKVFEYGKYNYKDWIKELKTAKLVITITGTETQSIAKYEVMNFNIPLLNYQQNTRLFYDSGILVNYANTLPDINESCYGKDFRSFQDFKKLFELYKRSYFNSINSKKIIKGKYTVSKVADYLLNLFNNI